MIHTTAKEGIVVMDRKSPRHNWRLVVHSSSVEHAQWAAASWKANAKNVPGWEEYQQHAERVSFPDGILPDNLPRNHQWEGEELEL